MIVNRLQIDEKIAFTDRSNRSFCTLSYDPDKDEIPVLAKYIDRVKEKYGSARAKSHNFCRDPKTGREYIIIYHD